MKLKLDQSVPFFQEIYFLMCRISLVKFHLVQYIDFESELGPFNILINQIKESENYPGIFYWFWLEL